MLNRIMAHLVAYYPHQKASLEIAQALADGGCSYLEIQFPFSDPTADGRFIEAACMRALQAGFRVDEGFKLIKKIGYISEVPIFIMSYAEIVFARGMEKFIKDAKAAGVYGLIIPDLPPDYDEGLFKLSHEQGIQVVPVVAPSISDERLKIMATTGNQYLYAALRTGITGKYTEIGEENIRFIERLKQYDIKVVGGFGIKKREQVDIIAPHLHAVVVGSEFIRVIQSTAREEDYYDAVCAKMKELSGKE